MHAQLLGSCAVSIQHLKRHSQSVPQQAHCLWQVTKQAQVDHSVWSALAAEAAGAANEGVGTDSEAVQHLRNVFQQRANLTALQQSQHERLAGSALSSGDSQRQSGEQWHSANEPRGGQNVLQPQPAEAADDQAQRGGRSSGIQAKERARQDEWWRDGSSGQRELVLADYIPGDGSSYSMPDPAVVLFCYNRFADLRCASARHLRCFRLVQQPQ